jgi:hypothetical protein
MEEINRFLELCSGVISVTLVQERKEESPAERRPMAHKKWHLPKTDVTKQASFSAENPYREGRETGSWQGA